MAVASFDELNILDSGLFEIPKSQMRSMPYEKYFGDMELTQEQIDNRIERAEQFEEAVGLFLLLMLMGVENGYDFGLVGNIFTDRLEELEIGTDEYRQQLANELIDSTLDHSDDPWYFSEDRMFFVSENEANTIENARDYEIAVGRGFRRKQWIGIGDRRERDTHRALNDTIIPIDDYFQIGFGQGLFPKDVFSPLSTLSAHPEEVISCRCTVRFLP